MGQVKRHFYVGTRPERANPPTSYQNPTPSNGKESGVLGGLMWEGEAQRRNITRQVRPEEKMGPASH